MKKTTARRRRKKGLPWGWMCLALTFVVVLICVAIPLLSTKEKEKEPENPDYLVVETMKKDTPYKASIQYPKINKAGVDEMVLMFINDQVADFEKTRKDEKALDITFKTRTYGDRLISYVFNTTIQTDEKTYSDPVLKSYTFDMETGNVIDFNDFFTNDTDFESFKSALATTYFESLGKKSEITSVDQVRTMFDASIDANQVFAFDNKALNIYFGNDVIEIGEDGIKPISVPLESLPGLKLSAVKPFAPTENLGTPAVSTYRKISRKKYLDSIENPKFIALTFDDGPNTELTPKLLDMLKEEDCRVTFFVLGENAERHPEIVKRAFDEDHQIGSHTMKHENLKHLTQEGLDYEILETEKLIKDITGVAPTVMRPPYGAFNDQVKATSNTAIVNWSVDPEDWKFRDSTVIANSVIKHTSSGSIILLHDIHKTSVEAVPTILKTLKDQGYTFVTMDELIELNGTYDSNGVYFGFDY